MWSKFHVPRACGARARFSACAERRRRSSRDPGFEILETAFDAARAVRAPGRALGLEMVVRPHVERREAAVEVLAVPDEELHRLCPLHRGDGHDTLDASTPAVSQVSIVPSGRGSGNRHRKQAVSPGRIVIDIPVEPTAPP